MIHIGDRLSQERLRKGYSLEEVAKATKIRESFLLAIEKGDYVNFPSGIYAYGFVKNYAKFLKLPEHDILALFKREYCDEKITKVLPEGLAKCSDFPVSGFKFTRAFGAFILIFILLLGYIMFQYRAAIFNPSLDIYFPAEDSVISSQVITVIGKTDPNTTVFVNSELAVLDKDGNFKKTIDVFPGKTKITIKSVNNFKRITTLERDIDVNPVHLN